MNAISALFAVFCKKMILSDFFIHFASFATGRTAKKFLSLESEGPCAGHYNEKLRHFPDIRVDCIMIMV